MLKQPARRRAQQLTDALMAHCKQTLAPYKYPRWVEYVRANCPRQATGKIQRFKLVKYKQIRPSSRPELAQRGVETFLLQMPANRGAKVSHFAPLLLGSGRDDVSF